MTVLARDGMGGLTHRAVATEAGVPLASASYHFTGIEDLVLTAMRQANDDLAAAMRADVTDRSITGLARLLAEELNTRPELAIAEYEFYLLAIRRPELRPTVLAWLGVLADSYAPELAGAHRRAFLAVIEGVFLHTLLSDGPADPAVIEATLRASGADAP